MNDARALSDYLRLPYRLGAGLSSLDAVPSGVAWLGATVTDEVTQAVATVLREGTTALRQTLPDAMCHVVYLRGSPVFDRITLIAPVWQQAIELLDLEPVVAELRREWGEERVDGVLFGARRRMAHELLGLESKSGIAKPLYRLRPPDDALFQPANLSAVLALIEGMPRLLDKTDEDVRDLVLGAPVLKLRPPTEAHFRRVVNGFADAALADAVVPRLPAVLPALANDLNAFVPLSAEAIVRAREALGLPNAGTAAEMLSVLRFAALTLPLLRPKTTSDLAFRLLTVIDAGSDLLAAQSSVLDVTRSLDAGEALRRLRVAHPHLDVSLRPYVLQAPAVATSAAGWLDVAARYRTNAASLSDKASMTLTSVRDLVEPQWSHLDAADQRDEAIEQLRKAVEAPSDTTVDAFGDTLFESTSVDIASKVRGVTSP